MLIRYNINKLPQEKKVTIPIRLNWFTAMIFPLLLYNVPTVCQTIIVNFSVCCIVLKSSAEQNKTGRTNHNGRRLKRVMSQVSATV